MTDQQILLLAVFVIVALTLALGLALAFAVRLLSAQVNSLSAPAGRSTEAPAKVPGAAKPTATAQTAARLAVPRRTAGIGLVIFTIVILAAGLGAGRFVNLMPMSASIEAGEVDLLFSSMLGIAVTIFLLVEGLLIYSAFRFRRKRGELGDGRALHGSSRLEVAWTVVPTIIVIWLGVYSYQILVQLQSPRKDAMLVEVTARQFQWQFHYPDTGVTATDLHVPVGKAVRIKLRSQDVIHSFWVPAFRVKQDAMPELDTVTYFTADVPGSYQVVCAEMCGPGHGKMGLISQVIVESQADYDAWMKAQASAIPSDPRVALFTTPYGCSGCHTLAAAGATGQIGPDLDGIGARAGTRIPGMSAPDYLHQSILDPSAFLAPECPKGPCPPGVMPQDFGARMPPPDLDAIVSLLLEQK